MNQLNIKQIDIRDKLFLEDYYETDTHWKQENLEKVVLEMSKLMILSIKKIIIQKIIINDFMECTMVIQL